MSVTNYLEASPELRQLFKEIYTDQTADNLISKVTRFIEIIIELCDSNTMNSVEAAYIITDILLKYDNDDVYERVFDISSGLEIADSKANYYSEKEIEESWQELKSQFELVRSEVERF